MFSISTWAASSAGVLISVCGVGLLLLLPGLNRSPGFEACSPFARAEGVKPNDPTKTKDRKKNARKRTDIGTSCTVLNLTNRRVVGALEKAINMPGRRQAGMLSK